MRQEAEPAPLLDPVARMLELDVACMLPNDTLLKADKLSMAHSVELRVPFLDHAVVELAARILSRLKVRRRALKHVLRRAAARLLPAPLLARRKLGFTAPVEALLRDELRPLVEDLLLDWRLAERGLFDPREVARLVRRATRPVAGSASRADSLAARQVFALLMLELWYRRFVDRGAAEGEQEAEAPPRTVEGVPATAENA